MPHTIQPPANYLPTALRDLVHAVFGTDMAGLVTGINPAAEKLSGFVAAEVAGMRPLDTFFGAEPGEVGAKKFEEAMSAARRGLSVEVECNALLKGGGHVPVLLGISPWRDDHGLQHGFLAVAVDIIQRRRTEQQLHEQENQYRLLFDNMTTGFFLSEIVCDATGKPVDYRYLQVNPAFEKLTGLKGAEVLQRTARQVLPQVEDYWVESFGRVAQTGQPMAYENYSAPLQRHFDCWVFSPSPGKAAVIFTDITERKLAEAELRQKNSLLAGTLEATADGILVVGGDGRVTSYNRQFVELWHAPPELLEKKEADALTQFFAQQLSNPAMKMRRLDEMTKSETFDLLEFADGRVFERFSRPQIVEKKVVGRVWSFRDVTLRHLAVVSLRENEHKFKTLFETANDAILLTDGSVFLDCNHKAETMLGCSREKILAQPIGHFSPGRQPDGTESRPRINQMIAAALGGTPQFYEWVGRRADGTSYNAEISLNRIEVRGQHIVQAIIRDITARKQAEAARQEAESLYRTLVHASPNAICVVDLDGRFIFSSPKGLELYGLPDLASKLGRNATDFVAEADRAAANAMIRSALAGEADAGGRFNMIRGDGTHFIGEFNCCPLRDALGVVGGAMIIARDVTERQQQNDELKSKNQELERFTYTVSHDLKSPLITIKGFAGALLADVNAGRTDRLGEDLKRIVLAADKMTALLNGLLELSRVGRIVNAPVEVSMDKVARDVVELLSGPIKQQAAVVTVQPDLPAVQGDPQRLQTVLQNLVENALKFPRAGSPPVIAIGTEILFGRKVFLVRDEGQGIEPRHHETIFGLFNKLDARSEGAGIGLALVRRIVEFHGGEIWVKSEGAGTGATFYFSLPFAPAGAGKPGAKP
jgi:PAS domain S-box-containing protein